MASMHINTILIISSHFYPVTGGTPTHAHRLCQALAEIGKDVHLITAGGDAPYRDDIREFDLHQTYRIHRIPTHKSYKNDLAFLFSIRSQLPNFIREFHPEIIDISTGNFVPLVLRFTNCFGVPIVYTIHNVPPEEHSINAFSKIPLLRDIAKTAYFSCIKLIARLTVWFGKYNSIIAVSENTKKKLIAIHAKPDFISVVGNGISIPSDTSAIQTDFSDEIRILTVAGVIEHKGQINMIYALPKILAIVPNVKYYIVGSIRSPEYRKKIESMIQELGVESSVKITGEVSVNELQMYYDSCDIYVQPSYQEGFCIAILDAMIRGKPVIGTDVGEVATFIGTDRGILLEMPNPTSLADAVLRYVYENDFVRSMAKCGCDFIREKYSWKKVAAETMCVFEKTLSEEQTKNT